MAALGWASPRIEEVWVPDGSGEPESTRTVGHTFLSGPEDGPDHTTLLAASVPRVVVKADLVPSLGVLSAVAMFGLLLGWVWSLLAPPQHGALRENGEAVPMLVESFHRFDAVGIFMVLNLAAGVLIAAGLWMLRGRRGPVVLLAAVVGSVLGSLLAIGIGNAFANGMHPMPSNAQVGDLVRMAPQISTLWVVLVQPFALAMAYGLAASWNGLDDLGRRR